jgi:hypothetical protein
MPLIVLESNRNPVDPVSSSTFGTVTQFVVLLGWHTMTLTKMPFVYMNCVEIPEFTETANAFCAVEPPPPLLELDELPPPHAAAKISNAHGNHASTSLFGCVIEFPPQSLPPALTREYRRGL